MVIGTSGVTFMVTDRYLPEPEGRLNTFCHAIPNTWFWMGVTMSAAGSMKWFRDVLAARITYSNLDTLAASIGVGSEGLIFLPYLCGERHPHAAPTARASFIGLTLRHGLPHMIRAVMEGVAFSLRDLMELFRQQGIQPGEVVISGWAVNSTLWQQIIADVIGLPVSIVNASECAAFGAAILVLLAARRILA